MIVVVVYFSMSALLKPHNSQLLTIKMKKKKKMQRNRLSYEETPYEKYIK